MAHHAVFVRVGDRPLFQRCHGGKSFGKFRLYLLYESRIKSDAADVEIEIELLVVIEPVLITLPKCNLVHSSFPGMYGDSQKYSNSV